MFDPVSRVLCPTSQLFISKCAKIYSVVLVLHFINPYLVFNRFANNYAAKHVYNMPKIDNAFILAKPTSDTHSTFNIHFHNLKLNGMTENARYLRVKIKFIWLKNQIILPNLLIFNRVSRFS